MSFSKSILWQSILVVTDHLKCWTKDMDQSKDVKQKYTGLENLFSKNFDSFYQRFLSQRVLFLIFLLSWMLSSVLLVPNQSCTKMQSCKILWPELSENFAFTLSIFNNDSRFWLKIEGSTGRTTNNNSYLLSRVSFWTELRNSAYEKQLILELFRNLASLRKALKLNQCIEI